MIHYRNRNYAELWAKGIFAADPWKGQHVSSSPPSWLDLSVFAPFFSTVEPVYFRMVEGLIRSLRLKWEGPRHVAARSTDWLPAELWQNPPNDLGPEQTARRTRLGFWSTGQQL